jgi:hypothetical protein
MNPHGPPPQSAERARDVSPLIDRVFDAAGTELPRRQAPNTAATRRGRAGRSTAAPCPKADRPIGDGARTFRDAAGRAHIGGNGAIGKQIRKPGILANATRNSCRRRI